MVSSRLLQRYPFFASLTEQQLETMSMIGEEKSFGKDSVLFDENTAANKLMVLLDGNVSLFYGSDSSPICAIAPGAIFGVSALIEPYNYTSSARATVESKVIEIDGAGLRRMTKKDPTLDHALMNNVAAAVLSRLHLAVGEF